MTDSNSTLLVSYGLVLFFAGIAAIGVFKPKLPTIAVSRLAVGLGKSLERWRRWFFVVPVLGPALEAYRKYGVVSPKAKWTALVTAWIGLAGCSMAFANGGMLAYYAIAGLGVTLTMLIGRLPTERDTDLGSYGY